MASTNNALERSNSSTAALPVTPERGRTRTRYPSHLKRQLDAEGNPRPLLHRRGTSRTYETLEDLLKEAGYKETRVFTPEVERREAEREQRKEHQAKQEEPSGAGVGVGGTVAKLFSTWMSTGTRRPHSKRVVANDEVRNISSSSPLAHRSSKASVLRQPSPRHVPSSSSLTVHPRAFNAQSSSLLQQQHYQTRPTLTATSTSTLQPPSRAHLALRHVASAPQIDKRRNGNRIQPRASRASKPRAPPLPVTWLESISAALLSPLSQPSSSSAPPSPSTIPHKPPMLTKRAHISVGAVTVTNVLCRSAPSSRSSSAVRHTSSAARPCRVLVPSLAQTVCEETGTAAAGLPYSTHRLPDPDSAQSDEDEDDELNLTMMLIPSKRQHSIRSLRSVLLQHDAPPPVPALPEEYARTMRRRLEESEAESDAEHPGEGHWDSGEFLTARVKRKRSRLPHNWGWTS